MNIAVTSLVVLVAAAGAVLSTMMMAWPSFLQIIALGGPFSLPSHHQSLPRLVATTYPRHSVRRFHFCRKTGILLGLCNGFHAFPFSVACFKLHTCVPSHWTMNSEHTVIMKEISDWGNFFVILQLLQQFYNNCKVAAKESFQIVLGPAKLAQCNSMIFLLEARNDRSDTLSAETILSSLNS